MRHYAAIIAGIQFGTCKARAAAAPSQCAEYRLRAMQLRRLQTTEKDIHQPAIAFSPLLFSPLRSFSVPSPLEKSAIRLRTHPQYTAIAILDQRRRGSDKIDNPSERICVRITFPADAAERVGATSSATSSNKGRSFSCESGDARIRAPVAAVAGIRLTGDACRKDAD